jgi:glycosyltransferase involved in cell wall biosynthesis
MTSPDASPTLARPQGSRFCGLKYCGPVLDPSGYAEFARSFIRHLDRCGVPLCLDIVTYDKGRPQLGAEGKRLEELRQRTIDYRAKIINANPDCFRGQCEAGRVNIGFTMFETTRIPSRWVRACNEMDGILVPSTWTRTVFEESGVTVPVRVAAPGIELPDDRSSQPPLIGSIGFRLMLAKLPRARGKIRLPRMFRRPPARWQAVDFDDYAQAWKFYSIFQWTERKNGHGLLRSYFAEFRKADNVCLVLKTYRRDTTAAEQARVAAEIVAVRDSMQLPDHAPVLLVSELLSREQIGAIHRAGDCFVLPHRAEGFGMPHLEAMAHGHAVIATGFSGNLEFMDRDNSILLPCQLRPVTGMGWSDAYDGDMMWADPDLGALRQAMRLVYADRQYAAGLGRQARQHAESNFAWNHRVERFLSAVNEIIAMAQSRRGGALQRLSPAAAAA